VARLRFLAACFGHGNVEKKLYQVTEDWVFILSSNTREQAAKAEGFPGGNWVKEKTY
jgi:hypothetical protein